MRKTPTPLVVADWATVEVHPDPMPEGQPTEEQAEAELVAAINAGWLTAEELRCLDALAVATEAWEAAPVPGDEGQATRDVQAWCAHVDVLERMVTGRVAARVMPAAFR